jgi:hypothetical protein
MLWICRTVCLGLYRGRTEVLTTRESTALFIGETNAVAYFKCFMVNCFQRLKGARALGSTLFLEQVLSLSCQCSLNAGTVKGLRFALRYRWRC